MRDVIYYWFNFYSFKIVCVCVWNREKDRPFHLHTDTYVCRLVALLSNSGMIWIESSKYKYLFISCFFSFLLNNLIVFIELISSMVEYQIFGPLWRRLLDITDIRRCVIWGLLLVQVSWVCILSLNLMICVIFSGTVC